MTARHHRSPLRQGAGRHLGLAVLAAALVTCAGTPPAPPQASGQAFITFYAVNHGWHVGLVIEGQALAAAAPLLAESLPVGRFLEIGWGDARYYQAPEPGVGLTLRAVLWPTESVLHVAGFHDAPSRFFGEAEVVSLGATPAGHRELLAYIAESFARSPDGRPMVLGPGWYGTSRFFAARGAFHAGNTCNTWAARAAARAGLPVADRLTITAGGLMDQLRPLGQPPRPGLPGEAR
jgi:uncharacterized protein (TIGR02117 family)